MNSRLFWKLFGLQLLAIATVLLLALGVMRARTASSFSDFLHAQQTRQLQGLADELALAYAESSDWRQSYRAVFGELPHAAPPARGSRDSGPPHAPRSPVGRRGPDAGRLALLADPDGVAIFPRRQPPGFDRGPRAEVKLDGVVRAVVWRPPGSGQLMAAERAFQQRQRRALGYTWLLSLPVAMLFAAILARGLLVPIRRLSDAQRRVAGREFTARVSVLRNDELGMLAQQFNRMAEALERYESRQRQWLSDISHELRTPLAVLRGELEALQDGVRETTPRAVASLKEEVERLAALVDDIHLLATTDAGELRLNPEELDLNVLVKEAGERFAVELQLAGFELRLKLPQGPVLLRADAPRLMQVLANLLTNVRLHALPGPVFLAVTSDAERLGFSVQDSGPGVSAENLSRLFDRLYRVDHSRQRVSGGSGLGLSICRGIVEAHGGHMEASNRDGGLCLECWFPVDRA